MASFAPRPLIVVSGRSLPGVAALALMAVAAQPIVVAQQPGGQPPASTSTSTTTTSAPAEQPAAAKPYHYDPEGRRDPFVSLVARGADSAAQNSGRRAETAAGLLVSEVSLKGIVQSRGEFVAMIQGPDTKTFAVRANDRLLDGTIKSITAQTLVIMQDVNDPLSTVKQREVRKVLRAPQEAK